MNQTRKKNIFRTLLFSAALLCTTFFSTLPVDAVTQETMISEVDIITSEPQPRIKIPGLNFTPGNEVKKQKRDDGVYLSIPFLGEYLGAIYKWSVSIAGVVAVIIILFSGVQMMLPGNLTTKGTGDQKQTINQAKKRIGSALIGLFLAVGSYTILYLVNPELVQFRNLGVKYVEREPLEIENISKPNLEKADKPIDYVLNSNSNYMNEKKGLPDCSPELAQLTAKTLTETGICVGPCHCAYSASHFLQYIGCNTPYSGSATRLPVKFEQAGWKVQKLSDLDKTDLPVGLLWQEGHVGVSVGNGKDWESGGGFYRLNSRKGGSCPTKFYEAMKNPSACKFCSKIPGEGPATGRFGDVKIAKEHGLSCPKATQCRGASGCQSNQYWEMGDITKASWKLIVSPASVSTPNKGCCIDYWAGHSTFTSQTLCDAYGGKWDPNPKNPECN